MMRTVVIGMLAGCWTSSVREPPPATPAPVTPRADTTIARGLFELGRTWTYRWTATTGSDPAESGTIECRVSALADWNGAPAANLECDGNLADVEWNPSFDPLGGAWGRVDGLWRLEYLPRGVNVSPSYTLAIEAEESSEPIESMGEVVGSTRIFRTRGLWCRREDNPSVPWHFELCFDKERIVRGELHTEDKYGARHVTFALDE